MMKRVQKGFTLIELMIVVAIIGILAAVALPAYQDFLVKGRWAEPLAAAGACKTAVTDYYQGRTPNSFTGIPAKMCDQSSKFVKTIDVDATGKITVTMQNTTKDTPIEFTPADAAGTLITAPAPIEKWVCSVATGYEKYLPSSCQK